MQPENVISVFTGWYPQPAETRQQGHTLTTWRKDLLEKLTVACLVKKFPYSYATRSLISVLTGWHHEPV
jgi:hypothetical protein